MLPAALVLGSTEATHCSSPWGTVRIGTEDISNLYVGRCSYVTSNLIYSKAPMNSSQYCTRLSHNYPRFCCPYYSEHRTQEKTNAKRSSSFSLRLVTPSTNSTVRSSRVYKKPLSPKPDGKPNGGGGSQRLGFGMESTAVPEAGAKSRVRAAQKDPKIRSISEKKMQKERN